MSPSDRCRTGPSKWPFSWLRIAPSGVLSAQHRPPGQPLAPLSGRLYRRWQTVVAEAPTLPSAFLRMAVALPHGEAESWWNRGTGATPIVTPVLGEGGRTFLSACESPTGPVHA